MLRIMDTGSCLIALVLGDFRARDGLTMRRIRIALPWTSELWGFERPNLSLLRDRFSIDMQNRKDS